MKTFYDTELLENARPELIHTQFARKQALPAGRGKTVEWRKWNTLEDAGALTEGVIPTGQKFGQSAVTQATPSTARMCPCPTSWSCTPLTT